MPELCRFYGIIIRMFHDDHPPAHFHAVYGGESAKYSVEDLAPMEGRLTRRVHGRVIEWATLHRDELREAWVRRGRDQPLGRIPPLE